MGFDLRGCCCGGKGGPVDEERFVLDGGVWDEVVGGDLMSGEGEGVEGSEGHC